MSLKIATLNVNGIRASHKKGLLDWVAAHKPDVFCLQEVRATQDVAPAEVWCPDALGYEAHWYPAERAGYSGTGLWLRKAAKLDGRQLKASEVRRGMGFDRADAEGRLIGACLGSIDVYSVYVPSGSSSEEAQAYKDEFLPRFSKWLEARAAEASKSGKAVIVAGDINIAHTAMDIKNAKANEKNSGYLPHERTWMSKLLGTDSLGSDSLGAKWQDLYRVANPTTQAYSWWSQRGAARAKNVGWRIDYLLGTADVRVTAASIHPEPMLSDHAPVLVTID
jgi:exodeoxyribonuclease-3